MKLLLFVALCLASAVTSTAEQTASIVTFNIRYPNPGDGLDYWPHRSKAVAKFISAHDIVGLQEARFSQLKDIDPSLSDFQRYSVGRDDGGESGETTTIYFRASRFELKSQGTIWLSPESRVAGSKGWDAALPRIMSWAVLKDLNAGHDWLIANTHFDHRGKVARAESGKLVRSFLAQKRSDLGGNLPVVLLGDFNCGVDSEPYRNIIAAASIGEFRDARKVSQSSPSGATGTWNGFKRIEEGKIIDHIFVAGPTLVLNHKIHDPKTDKGRFASDHLPVSITAKLEVRQK